MTEVRSWQDAEEFAANQMVSMGFSGVTLTPGGPDQGFDIVAEGAAAQVKHYGKPVGGPVLQQLVGSARPDTTLLCFALNGYTAAALDVAAHSDVALYSYSPLGELVAENPAAGRLLERGWVDVSLETRRPEFEAIKASIVAYTEAVLNAALVFVANESASVAPVRAAYTAARASGSEEQAMVAQRALNLIRGLADEVREFILTHQVSSEAIQIRGDIHHHLRVGMRLEGLFARAAEAVGYDHTQAVGRFGQV